MRLGLSVVLPTSQLMVHRVSAHLRSGERERESVFSNQARQRAQVSIFKAVLRCINRVVSKAA
jgi:hypothetical protein